MAKIPKTGVTGRQPEEKGKDLKLPSKKVKAKERVKKPKKSKKKSPIRKEYEKERRRIQNYISRKRREGYIVDYDVPPIPKRVTRKAVNELKAKTAQKLKESMVWLDRETGEILTPQEVTKRKRQQRKAERELQKKQEQARREQERLARVPTPEQLALATFEAFIDKLAFSPLYNRINAWYQALIEIAGRENVGRAMRQLQSMGIGLSTAIGYDERYMSQILSEIENALSDVIGTIETGYLQDLREQQYLADEYLDMTGWDELPDE